MPANRSRTERWRESLRQICSRGSGIELTLASKDQLEDEWPDTTGGDLLWRVRLYEVHGDEMIVEAPTAAGSAVKFENGVRLVGVMSVGQNRWMFHTNVLETKTINTGRGRSTTVLRITMPETVERCQRRSFYRISTAALRLPQVQSWPVLDPASIPGAETANRGLIRSLRERGEEATSAVEEAILPEVGPGFTGHLVNVSGGGLGLLVDKADGGSVQQLKNYWLQLDLRPGIPAPLGLAGKIVHTHFDSSMNVYCGLAFEFNGNVEHRDFVVGEITEYVAALQREQLQGNLDAA